MCWLNVDDDEVGCYVITMSDTKGVSKIYMCFSQYGLDDEMGGIQYRERECSDYCTCLRRRLIKLEQYTED